MYPSSIVGEIDFVGVDESINNVPLKFYDIVKSIGRISMGCTATHIGSGYVVSAGHCFKATETVQYNKKCEDIRVRWGYRGGQAQSLESQCQRILVMQNRPGRDYVLFHVDPYPEAFVPLATQKTNYDNSLITLFSHPKGLPLQWSQYCYGRKLDAPPRSPEFLYHQCDTQPGSSGAGVIQDRNLRLIGIHKGGLDFDSLGTWNFATLIYNTPIPKVLKTISATQDF